MTRGKHLRAATDSARSEKRKGMPVWIALVSASRGYCPNCHVGRLSQGLRPRMGCDVCGMVYHRDSSTWLGTAFLMYCLASLLLIGEAVGLGLLFGFFPGFVWVMSASAIVMIVLLFRPTRGIWIWFLWRLGFLN